MLWPNQVMASFFLFYVTVILHIPSIAAGIIVAISVIWDAITDPWIGHISDQTRSKRFGRRHGYLLLGGIGTALGMLLLWSISPQYSDVHKMVLLVLYVLLSKTMLTFYGAPYFAMGATLSQDYDERSSLQSFRSAFHVFGMIIAVAGMTVVFFHSTADYPKGQLNPDAYPAMGIAVAIITFIIALFTIRTLPKDYNDSHTPQPSGISAIWQHARACLVNSNFRAIVVMIFLIEVGFQISITIGFHVSTYTYQLTGPQIGLLGVTILVFSIFSQPLWIYLSRRFEKKTALIIGMLLGITGFIGLPIMYVGLAWLPLNQPNTIAGMMVFSVLSGIGNGAFMSLPFSMLSDSADQSELTSGKKQAGLFFGLYQFAYKAGIAISVLISGVLLDVIGFDAQLLQQAPDTRYYLAMVPAWLLILLAPVIYWQASQYQLDRATHQEIRRQLAQRAGHIE